MGGRVLLDAETDGKVLLDADIREPLFNYLELYYGKVRFIAEKLIAKVPAEVLHEQISEELFERDYTIYD